MPGQVTFLNGIVMPDEELEQQSSSEGDIEGSEDEDEQDDGIEVEEMD